MLPHKLPTIGLFIIAAGCNCYGLKRSVRGGHLYMKLDIILVKKYHVIRVVFGTRRCTCVHRLGEQNHAKSKKECVFVIFYKFGKGHDGKNEGGKKHAKMRN